MKRILTYSILIAFILLSACRKSDNPKIPTLIDVTVPLITKDAAGDGTISKDNPLAFKGKFVVDMYFKNGPQPSKFDVVVIKNGDKTNIKHIKDGITTFPTTVDITGQQLTTLFNAPIVLGDVFTIGVDVTTAAGQLFQAFPQPAKAQAYGAGLNGQPGASTSIDYIAVCPYNINDFVGPATVVDNDFWEDTYPVTITLQGSDTYKVDGYVQTPGYSFLIKVNVATQTLTIAKQIYGPKLPGTPYLNPAIEGKGVVDACKHQLVLSVEHTVSIGSFGPATVYIKAGGN